MDGTFASLTEGRKSSIARIHAMLSGEQGAVPARVQLHYAPGQQWAAWRTLPQLVSGQSLDQNIHAAYAWLARHWRPGNPLYFFGYSRGGIGVCALADMIERLGLLKPEHASDTNIGAVWDLYRHGRGAAPGPGLCHPEVPIRMVGLLDTVMSLGVRLPFLWTVSEPGFDYAKGYLAGNVQQGVHALALDETRLAFAPILWGGAGQRAEQAWFRGCHADIGGQLGGHEFARPLANLPLVWLMSRAEEAGLPLPDGWRRHHPCDVDAPQLGSWHSWGKAFLMRAPRRAGLDGTETIHHSVPQPYSGPAELGGNLAGAVPEPAARRLRLWPSRGGTDNSATA
ncbi:DUF2235 domain-containing protein [Paracoccus sp. CPCC 101403]|uniref:DUF2235 domain-containing protein n=2 Tax=Paracoccus broussonetiae TaxID=3075834 RepID=A0ABU3EG63_9RHOB|nr:DUF2235 domain-containing protein [Paracoccus sp. CPCC 101403]